jgi:uncharacterized protein involved in exopolysaccharide biosynthesis
MITTHNENTDGEIDLANILSMLWAYKFLIICISCISVFIGGLYTSNLTKLYVSETFFIVGQEKNQLSIPSELGALAGYMGASTKSSLSLSEKIFGRVFIDDLEKIVNFTKDPYFNNYNQYAVDPYWKLTIKKLIGWQKSETDIEEVKWQKIVSKYKKNVEIDQLKSGVYQLSVTHLDANRAAFIANKIMNKILNDIQQNKTDDLAEQTQYLSNALAGALTELELSQYKLKEFRLKNSALPIESFASESLKLDALREKLSKTVSMYDAIQGLSILIINKNIDIDNYEALRKQFPIIDQVEFRRVLGQNEIITNWSWPDEKIVMEVLSTLNERKKSLQSQISVSKENAERFSSTLEVYAKLERASVVAEATYTVLIEQVKAQNMISGFHPDNSEIYEYAVPSVKNSSPNHMTMLVISALIGIFIGCLTAFIISHYRDVYYSKRLLIARVNASFSSSIKPIFSWRNKRLTKINDLILKKQPQILRDLTIEIYKNNSPLVIVSSLDTKFQSNKFALILASYMQTSDNEIAIMDFSNMLTKPKECTEEVIFDSFIKTEISKKISLITLKNNTNVLELLSKQNFSKNYDSLSSSFDTIIMCADGMDGISLARSVQDINAYHISLARTKNTKSKVLSEICQLLPVQGLLYD